MARFDKYDVIGLIVLGLLAALWIAHFVAPAPPPDPAVITLTRNPATQPIQVAGRWLSE
jgi:hypothetical protein